MGLEQLHQQSVNGAPVEIEGIRVAFAKEIAVVAPLWRDWQAIHNTTVFQTIDWCSHWMDVCGEGSTPHIIYGIDSDGAFVFFLPMCVENGALKWIGQQHLIYGYGIYGSWALSETGRSWFERNITDIIRMDASIDRIELKRMPDTLNGQRNPLLSLSNCIDPDTSCLLQLKTDYESLLTEKRSSATRATIRNKDKRLANLGEITFDALYGTSEAHAALEDLLRDQASRLLENGIGDPIEPCFRELLHLWLDADIGLLRVMRLSVGGRNIASLLTSYHNDTVIFLMISLASGPERKFSPGDLALRKSIEYAIDEGYKIFDFSLGALGYKAPWTDVVITHHHAFRAVRAKGFPRAMASLGKHRFRKWFKSTPVVWDNFEKLRRRLKGKPQAAEQ